MDQEGGVSKHIIQYDDGQLESLNLATEEYKVVRVMGDGAPPGHRPLPPAHPSLQAAAGNGLKLIIKKNIGARGRGPPAGEAAGAREDD